jgi:phosphatidate cytidylyltransferase
MSHLEPPEYDLRGSRYRARHDHPVAPDPYPPLLDDFELDRHNGQAHRPEPPPPPPPASTGRAGRNLPAAILVGSTLGAIVLASLLIWRPAFIGVVVAAAAVGVWEMARAVARDGGPRAPLVPLFGGSLAMITLAWFTGPEALTLGLVLTVLAATVWRLADGPRRYQGDLLTAILIAVYVPFLGAFAVLLARPEDGALRVIAMLVAVVLSDTGGYVAGVFFGRTAMAPTVSPKKSWEGTAGSLLIAATGSALYFFFLFHVPWWHGALFGLGVSAASVLGDLGESLLKRDLKVKDMSNLLPGHGGLMDRLDSVLFAAPTAFVLFMILAPPPG